MPEQERQPADEKIAMKHHPMQERGKGRGPLAGMLVLDLGNGAAGPFASTLLADFGADVVKIERPGQGDALRSWDYAGGVWWRSMSRGKRSIAVDMSTPEGHEITKALIKKADVVVESFRPGVMEQLGFGPDQIAEWNPQAILLRISGYGQTGPYRTRPGYGKAAEAFAGLLHMTGFPDGPPVYVGFPIADMCSGVFGALGIVLSLVARQRGMAQGQVVDLALYESVLRIMDYLVPMASGSDVDLYRNGNRQPMNFAPSGIFRTRDDRWVLYSAASAETVRRVVSVVSTPEHARHPDFETLASTRAHADEIDQLVAAYCARHTAEEIVNHFTEARAVAAVVKTPQEIVRDPHILARGSIVPVEGEDAMFVNVVPVLSETPGAIRFSGPRTVGCDAEYVLRDLLGYGDQDFERALASGVVQLAPEDKGSGKQHA